MIKYLLRLDDACPTMYRKNWYRIENILNRYNIKPLVGVIPSNQDEKQKIDIANSQFWNLVHRWKRNGWEIALHGYNHVYISRDGGINPIWQKSEFAGIPLEWQREKLRKGIEIFYQYGIEAQFFFAPSHTFDNNTITAIKLETNIKYISDTIAFKPYYKDSILFIPQQLGCFKNIVIPGIWTFCYHPSNLKEEELVIFEEFIKQNHNKFSSFDVIVSEYDKRSYSFLDKLLSFAYFGYRKILYK